VKQFFFEKKNQKTFTQIDKNLLVAYFLPTVNARLQHATALHQAGRLAEAQPIYRQILATDPNNADALHLLGVLAHQTGYPDHAEPLIRRALAAAPAAFAFHNSLGNVLRAQNRAAEAEAAYRAAIRLQPNIPDFHHHLGQAQKDQGRLRDAEAAFRQAIRLGRGFLPARIDLAALLVESGRFTEAEACARAALKAAPRDAPAHNALGLALAAQHKHEAALAAFDAALAAAPGYANATANRANCLAALERHEEAVIAYQAALALTPDAPDLRLGLARSLLFLERGADVEQILRAELTARPDDPHVLAAMGMAMALQDRTADALECLRHSVRLAPAEAKNWEAIGLALRDLARWPEALEPFAEAARLAPDNADIRANYAYALLANGDFAAAWPHFEWRTKKPGNARLREATWDGSPTDCTVLIHAEQGLGDTMQFVRFVPEAARRAKIILGCPDSLNALLRTSLLHASLLHASLPDASLPDTSLPDTSLAGLAGCISGEPVPPYDLHCPIMSLPNVLGMMADHFADPVPYLHADRAKLAAWRARLQHLAGPRIGLVWAGNPKYPADRRRSLSTAVLAPLLALPDVTFVSLQVGAAPPAPHVFDATPWLHDFTDTAAAVAALDLVIAVDTSVAHLAGAMGRPVWLLNRADTDWRWLLDREDSPWYPSMRIFRQPSPGAWGDVIGRVASALGNFQPDIEEEKEEFLF